MARVLVHALAATAGGGVTYLRNFLSTLAEGPSDHQWLFLLPPGGERFLPDVPHVEAVPVPQNLGSWRRLWFDQWPLRGLIADQQADLLLATGNFGMIRPPVPQILLNRNALYFSRRFVWDLARRREVKMLAEHMIRRRLALTSIRHSVLNVVPTAAFTDLIREHVPDVMPNRFRVLPHGFRPEAFENPTVPLADSLKEKLGVVSSDPDSGPRRILMVSHYNYFRNFETLLDGFALLARQHQKPIQLVLTTNIEAGVSDNTYDTSRIARQIERLGIRPQINFLGNVPHDQLPALYQYANLVVCPSYCESFGHPLLEAMGSGRPVVASDEAVHRELCQDAAWYFPTFDAEALAQTMGSVLELQELSSRKAATGRQRARRYCWRQHVDSIQNCVHEFAHSAHGKSRRTKLFTDAR